jgi:ribosome maturation factor RimP
MQTTQLSTLETAVWQLVAPVMEDMGLRVVRVNYGGETLQIMLEPQTATAQNRVSVTLDECESASRAIAAQLDVEDPIASAYKLEVSSTGLERPLVTAEDFTAYLGNRIMVKTAVPMAGKRKNIGFLRGLEEGAVALELADTKEEITVPLEQIKNAELAFTDAEYNEIFRAHSQAAKDINFDETEETEQ